MSDEIYKKICTVFADVFGVDESQVLMTTTIDNLDEWDSLQHLELVTNLEEAFGIKFEMSEIISLNSIERIIEVLNEKQG